MKIPLYLTIFFCLLVGISLPAQNEDSLRKACSGKNDSLKIDAHIQLGKYYYIHFGNTDSLISYGHKAEKLSERNPLSEQRYQIARLLSTGYIMADDFTNAKPSIAHSLVLAQELKDDKKIADVYHMFAAYFGNQGMNDSALSYLILEADAARRANYYGALAMAYTSIAWNYQGRGQQDKQLQYHRKALGVVDKMETSNMGSIIQVYVTCAQGYTGIIAFPGLRQTLMDSARVLADSVIALSAREDRRSTLASGYYVYSQCDLYDENYEAAVNDAQRALIYREFIDGRTVMILHAALAMAYGHLNNKALANVYLDSAKSSPFSKELYYRNHLAQVAFEIYTLAGDGHNAKLALEEYQRTNDSLSAESRAKSINEIEQRFNKSENERTIKEMAQEQEISTLRNRFLTAGILVALLTIIFGFVLSRQRALKSKQNLLEAEQRLNRARMNPHFFFNTLASLQTYALDEEDRTKVANFISKYSKIMRKTLESTYTEFVTVYDEVEFLDQYLQLQQLRLEGKFDYSVTVEESLDQDEYVIPPMLVQPFIENSIEHGLSGLSGKGKITVHIAKASEGLEIRVTDNGVGMQNKKEESEHKSRATEITRDRLLLLNTKYKSQARFEIKTNPAGSGTLVIFHLPNISK